MNESKNTIPDRLVKSFFDDGVVAFVGAGLSVNEGLPTWQVLIESMFQEIKSNLSEDEQKSISEHIAARNFLLVADYLKSKFNEIRYKDFIENKFLIKKEGVIHRLLLSIPFKGIITTNYDTIFSYSDGQNEFNAPFTYEDPDVFRKTKKKFLLHAHGIATTPGSTILSFTDYDNLNFGVKNIMFWETMKSLFQRHRVLFIGYSLNDPDINIFLTKLKYTFSGNFNEHFALIDERNSDLLHFHRLTKIFGVEPIFLQSNLSMGESVHRWVEQLKSLVLAESIPRLQTNYESYGLQGTRITELMQNLFLFVNEKYSLNEFIQKIHSILRNPDYEDQIDSFETLWSKIILKLPIQDLKKLVSSILTDFPNSPNLKKLITYLP